MGIQAVLASVQAERFAQDLKWGEQNHPDLSPRLLDMIPGLTTTWDDTVKKANLAAVARYYGIPPADRAKEYCQGEHDSGAGSWFSIHVEELAEALEAAALGDTVALRTELVQLAATVTAHVEAIDRRGDPLYAIAERIVTE